MKAALIGISKDAVNMAYSIIKSTKNVENPNITVSGIYMPDVEPAVNAAVFLNIKVYLSLSDLLGEADVLLISANSKSSAFFTDLLKENCVQNKILCYFSALLDSSDFFCGYANTYVTVYMPFNSGTNKLFGVSDSCIMVEGEGRRFDEFAAALASLKSSFKVCTKYDKALAVLANHFVTDLIGTVLDIAVSMYKFAGVYSSKNFAKLLYDALSESKTAKNGKSKKRSDSITGQAQEAFVRKTFKLLNDLNYSDFKDMYRVLEAHFVNTGKYSDEEKEKLNSLIKRLR